MARNDPQPLLPDEMTFMLCRNRVADFRRWKRVFDSYARDHRASGLRLAGLWRRVGRPNDVFFLFEVKNLRKARAFIAAPAATSAGRRSGVIEGEYDFVRAPDYRRDRPWIRGDFC